jgi:hypothetical protein
VEHVTHLVADELNETALVELCGQRLADAIDGDQFGGALAHLKLALIDHQVGVGIVERDRGVGREILKQAQVALGVSILFEALHGEHAQHTSCATSGR